jgi:hypothetical protein
VAADAKLQIQVQPAGAPVYVDGLRSGSTPLSLTLKPGQHTVRVEQDGYEPWVETVNLAAGGTAVLEGDLVPLATSLEPTVTLAPTAGSELPQPLPDLLIKSAQISLETGNACDYTSTQLGLRVWLENAGNAPAGPFTLQANDTQQSVPNGLAAGQTLSLWFADYRSDSENTITVDLASQVEESNEGNNQFAQRLPIPTLPPPCTPSGSELSTSTPPAPTPTPQPPPQSVTMSEGQVDIPTYNYADATTQAWSDAFNISYPVLDRAAYDASNPVPSTVTYRTFVVENEYLRLTFLPDLGGRLYELFYKPAGHPVTYRNPVLKPSPWGPPEQGWWLAAGGFEWCLPVEEHGYEWGIPWKLAATGDGQSVTVLLRDSDETNRVRAEIAIRLQAGEARFTIRPRLENPTGAPLNVKYWTNAMLAPGGNNAPSGDLYFVLPDQVTAVTVHSRGDGRLPGYNERMPWPVFDGTDFSRLGNWDRWLGFFEDPAVGEFVAVYDRSHDEGVVRISDPNLTQGVKAFAFGWQDPIPASNWTDDRSSYVELHGGPAPTFDDSVTIPAGEHLQWTETWYPAAGLGGMRYANRLAALNLEAGEGQARLAVATTRQWEGDIVLLLNGQELWRTSANIAPGQPLRDVVAFGTDAPETGRLTLRLEAPDGTLAAEYGADFRLR